MQERQKNGLSTWWLWCKRLHTKTWWSF